MDLPDNNLFDTYIVLETENGISNNSIKTSEQYTCK